MNKKVSFLVENFFDFCFLIGIFCVHALGSKEDELDQAIQDGKKETT